MRRQHRTHRRSQRGDEYLEIIYNPDKVFMGFFNSTEISSLVSDVPLKQGHVVSDSVLTQGQFRFSVHMITLTSCLPHILLLMPLHWPPEAQGGGRTSQWLSWDLISSPSDFKAPMVTQLKINARLPPFFSLSLSFLWDWSCYIPRVALNSRPPHLSFSSADIPDVYYHTWQMIASASWHKVVLSYPKLLLVLHEGRLWEKDMACVLIISLKGSDPGSEISRRVLLLCLGRKSCWPLTTAFMTAANSAHDVAPWESHVSLPWELSPPQY